MWLALVLPLLALPALLAFSRFEQVMLSSSSRESDGAQRVVRESVRSH